MTSKSDTKKKGAGAAAAVARTAVIVRPIFLDKATVAACLALSESTVEKLVRENSFPRPRAISQNRVAWLAREIEEWAESRPVSEFLPPENTGWRKGLAGSWRNHISEKGKIM